MRIGVPKEIKNQEYRVGMVPGLVRELTKRGHEVWVEHQAGAGIGFSDEDYLTVGARIADRPKSVFDAAELIVKVKEPQGEERTWLRPDHTLFAYLHLAPDPDQTAALLASGATCIAYETVSDAQGGFALRVETSQARGSAGGCGDRPGWVFRELEADDPRRADLRRRGRGPLLRDQHAWRRSAYIHFRTEQRDLAVRHRHGK